MLKIKVLGAGREVGRSGFHINYNNTDLMLDYGLKIDEGVEFPLRPEYPIKHMILSHAHLDHCGFIPWLFTKNKPIVYMTPPTIELAELLWNDTLKIAKYEGLPLPFSRENIQEVINATQYIQYRQKHQIERDISFEMFDAGHILGSALTRLEFNKTTSLLYTGDFRMEESELHNGADIDCDQPKYVLTESTYGDRDHPKRSEVERDFIQSITETLDQGGSVILPSFAIGRAQEIIEILNKHKIKVPIYLDGMAQKVAKVYFKYPGYIKDAFELRKSLENTIMVVDQKQRKTIAQKQGIFVTTAGMLEGGPVIQYLKQLKNDKKSAMFLTGYQVEGTRGHDILHKGKFELEGQMYTPRLKVKHFDFSAHIGRSNLLRSLQSWNPEKVICIHGDEKTTEVFTKSIKEDLGIDAIAPKNGDLIKLQ